MKIQFKSEYFDKLTELLTEKNTLLEDNASRHERRKIVRKFSNGLATMSEEEARERGITEITNHLTTYRHLAARQSLLARTFSINRVFWDIKVHTSPERKEQDEKDSFQITRAFNDGLLYQGQAFSSFIKGIAGEIMIAGGVPVLADESGGWLPSLASNILLPVNCPLDSCKIPYAFVLKEFNLAQLIDLKKTAGTNSELVDVDALDALIATLKQTPVSGVTTSGSGNVRGFNANEINSVLEDEQNHRKTTIATWWFYEVKVRKDGTRFVSATLFTDELTLKAPEKKKDSRVTGAKAPDTGSRIIAYMEEAHQSPEDWLYLVAMDKEVGGGTTWSTIRGMAEIMYPSSSEIETLLNMMLEGDKLRAMPRFQIGPDASADEALAWDPPNEIITPRGILPFDMKGSSAPLMTPLSILTQNAASLSGGNISNDVRGGELRQQAVQRGNTSAQIETGDLADWFNHHRNIAASIVYNVLAGDLTPGTYGWQEVMWVRTELKKHVPAFKDLAERQYGRFKFLTVRIKKTLEDDPLSGEDETHSRFLLAILPKIDPGRRPYILKAAIAARTGDHDLAEFLITEPNTTINPQKVTAETECFTIFNRAVLGEAIVPNPGDIHQDHVPVHLKDMVGKIARHQLVPWAQIDVVEFAGLQKHTMSHLELMLEDKDSHDEGMAYMPQMQQIVAAAETLIQTVEQANPGTADQAQLTPAERAKIELGIAAESRKHQELGLKMEDMKNVQEQRMSRDALAKRKNFLAEITSTARLQLEHAKTQAGLAKTAAEIEAIKNPPKPAAKAS